MFHSPRAMRQPRRAKRRRRAGTANKMRGTCRAVSLRLVVGTTVAAGTWLWAGLGGGVSAFAEDGHRLRPGTSSHDSIESTTYRQDRVLPATSDPALLGPLHWNSSDSVWTSNSRSAGPSDRSRAAASKTETERALIPPPGNSSSNDADLFGALAATTPLVQPATPAPTVTRDALADNHDLLDALMAIGRTSPPPFVPDAEHIGRMDGTDDTAPTAPATDLMAGLAKSVAQAIVVPAPAPVPQAESIARPQLDQVADQLAPAAQQNDAIHFDVLAATGARPEALQLNPPATDMAGLLAPLYAGQQPNERPAAAPAAPADTVVARAEPPSGRAAVTTPLDTSGYVLPDGFQSPAIPPEFLASRFGSSVPVVQIAQAAPTVVAPADAIPTPTDGSPPFADGGADGEESLGEAEKLGEEPVNNQLQFLRTETVLLNPGDWQIDVGLAYLLQENDVPVVLLAPGGGVDSVVEGKLKERNLFVPLAIRYGLTRRTQLFVDVPLGWANTELSFVGSDDFDNSGGIGDVVVGATYLLRHCNNQDIVFTFAGTIPTGGDPFDSNLAFSAASLGQGFWALSGDLLCIKTYDPVVIFTGVGTRHYFERSFDGSDIRPGGEYRWQLGVGLAVNPRVTLSARFAAAYQSEVYVDGARVPGTIQEPMSIRLAATIAQPCKFVEPFVEFGTTDDAAATYFGIIWTY